MPVRGGGFIQGYNAQNVATADGLIIATQLTERHHRHRLVRAHDAADAAGRRRRGWQPPRTRQRRDRIGLVLANAGYLSATHNLTCPGPDRLIATGKRRDLEKRARAARQPTQTGGPAARRPLRWPPASPPPTA